MTEQTIRVTREGPVARVTLNRPQVRNALDAATIAELTAAFRSFASEAAVRVVVLRGEGAAFCGGADVNYMRAGLDLGHDDNVADALALADMFSAIDDCPMPVIAGIHGAALGGGSGLAAVCDIAIASADAVFGFTEVRLGIVPAVISPFVLRKIGQTHARALFTTGERFGAARAHEIGLVHEVVTTDDLSAAVEKKVADVVAGGPQATRLAKHIARSVSSLDAAAAREWTARTTAERRASDEGQEGLRAFLEKRKPAWK